MRTQNRGWKDRPLLASPGRSMKQLFAVFTPIVFGAALDGTLIAPVMILVLNETEIAGYAIAWLISLLAAAAAFIGGRLAKGSKGNATGIEGRLAATVTILVWLAVGVFLAVLRAVGMSMSVDIDEAAPAEISRLDMIAAVGFFLVYVLIGVLAFVEGKEGRNDAHAALVLDDLRLEEVRQKVALLEGAYRALTDEEARRWADVRGVDAYANAEVGRSQALTYLAMSHARTEIARHKGDPAVTGITSSRHPDHPRNTARAQ